MSASFFSGMNVVGCYQFRVTRNSDLFVDEEEIKNLHTALQESCCTGTSATRCAWRSRTTARSAWWNSCCSSSGCASSTCTASNGPVESLPPARGVRPGGRPALKYPPFTPGLPAALDSADLFEVLKKQELLLHHPFPILPAGDRLHPHYGQRSSVIAIKQTVYRTGTDSELMEILVEAARKGKEVTVVVELMARFDEEVNMNWAARLEEVGAHVVYGVVGHKTHAKMALIVRREDSDHGKVLRRYGPPRHRQLPSGHRAPVHGFRSLSAHEELCADVAEVFQQLTGLGRRRAAQARVAAPFTLHRRLIAAIRNEAKNAAEGKPARIIAKMNALLEPQIIEELYNRLGRRREDRPRRARRLRAAAGHRGRLRQHPRALGGRPLPRALAHLLFRETAAPRTCISRALTGWRAISSAASSCASRCSTRL